MGNNQLAVNAAPQVIPTNQTIVKNIVPILLEPGLARINFKLGNISVVGTNFARVAEAIKTGRIKCWTEAESPFQASNALANGMTINAQYQETPNAMVVQSEDFGTNPGEDRTIVHEAVHAALDLDAPLGKKTQTLSIDDEAAAVIAVAFYIRICNKQIGGFLMDADGPEKPALELVDRLIKTKGPVQMWPAPYVLGEEESRKIRIGAGFKWNYTQGIDPKDGLWTDNTTHLYTYGGVPVCGKKGCK
jgi:hypothetical protein